MLKCSFSLITSRRFSNILNIAAFICNIHHSCLNRKRKCSIPNWLIHFDHMLFTHPTPTQYLSLCLSIFRLYKQSSDHPAAATTTTTTTATPFLPIIVWLPPGWLSRWWLCFWRWGRAKPSIMQLTIVANTHTQFYWSCDWLVFGHSMPHASSPRKSFNHNYSLTHIFADEGFTNWLLDRTIQLFVRFELCWGVGG